MGRRLCRTGRPSGLPWTVTNDPTGAQEIEPRIAIVLAGRRSGEDALALAAGATHRALLEIEGEPMLVRVARRLLARPTLRRILINIDTPEALLALPFIADAVADGRIEVLESTDSPSRSVLESLDRAQLEKEPVLVTTADHALLDDAILDAFYREATTQEADLTIGMVPQRVIEARFPETRRTYLRFRDGGYSGANLFFFRSASARRAAEFWQTAERERKKPWRLARTFGWTSLLLFLTRRLTLQASMERASRIIGTRIQAVELEIAEAAVDVDKIEDLELVREILAARAHDRNEGRKA